MDGTNINKNQYSSRHKRKQVVGIICHKNDQTTPHGHLRPSLTHPGGMGRCLHRRSPARPSSPEVGGHLLPWSVAGHTRGDTGHRRLRRSAARPSSPEACARPRPHAALGKSGDDTREPREKAPRAWFELILRSFSLLSVVLGRSKELAGDSQHN
jgi:hypothetical protein